MSDDAWSVIEDEARDAFRSFPLRAYSELMPAPYVGCKPYEPDRRCRGATCRLDDDAALLVGEHEQAQELEPGLARIADHLVYELGKLVRGEPHALSHTLLDGNPAWPAELGGGALAGSPLVIALPVALSRTQDDKGQNRWTLFGASHEGPGAPFWRSLAADEDLDRWLAWAGVDAATTRILASDEELPPFLRARRLHGSLDGVTAVVTFHPFAVLPPPVRAAALDGTLTLLPSPASLIFFEHPRYRELARELPRATQIPLLHLFPRIDGSCTIRVPQSGWLDEGGEGGHGHRVVPHVARTHRWQRMARDDDPAPVSYTDKVSKALFSTDPDVIALYDKPLARNVEVWSADYRLVLDGPRAGRAELERAAVAVEAGGRFGYRFLQLPMRAGARELFWHLPISARAASGSAQRYGGDLLGYVTAEAPGAAPLRLAPRLLQRPAQRAAATLFSRDPGRLRFTTSHNARKLLEARELLGAPLAPSLARALLRAGKDVTLEAWLDGLPAAAGDADSGRALAATLRAGIGGEPDPGPALTLEHTTTREFEERVWRTIAELSEGQWRNKVNADAVTANAGRTGGPAARAAGVVPAAARDLDALGDELHRRHRALIARHGMQGRAEVVDHVFRWETDFAFPWMGGWTRNQAGAHERNVVVIIPGRDRGEAVIMGDHYDTAYMEDVYDADRGGDRLRAAAPGADDNCSATSALLAAADVLLPLSREGQLARDVWLVHLTGEEYPADCMGARALAQGLVERSLTLVTEDGERRAAGDVRVAGAFILDMIGHNSERERDVFQIAPGEGAASARLAERAHRATRRWNQRATELNRGRHGRHRARRMPDGSQPPPPFAHLILDGEIRVEWEPRSALFNTDGQIFSDVGVPVVLFMENYDISRVGYHDTLDTMAKIDLDYAAALTAIAIETVTDTAM